MLCFTNTLRILADELDANMLCCLHATFHRGDITAEKVILFDSGTSFATSILADVITLIINTNACEDKMDANMLSSCDFHLSHRMRKTNKQTKTLALIRPHIS